MTHDIRGFTEDACSNFNNRVWSSLVMITRHDIKCGSGLGVGWIMIKFVHNYFLE